MRHRRRIFSCRLTRDGPGDTLDHGAPVFPYWSFTKTAIAICALKLAEQGKIDLNVALPGHGFTLVQLLNHTSGLPDYRTLPEYRQAVADDEKPWPRHRLIHAAMGQGMLFAPGTGWFYSNIGYMLARDLIEDVAQTSFSDLFRQFVGDELGLQSVRLATTREEFSQVFWEAAKSYDPGWVGHGCLIGTAHDAARILHGLFSGRLLSDEMLGGMMSRHPLGGVVEGRPWTECGYALGLMSGAFGNLGRAIGHSGGGPFCVNAVYHFPDLSEPVTVACFTDGDDEGAAEFAALGCAAGE
ncbi:class A beta-lactamase-related serine hydrolase [Sinirhodobacter populi]|uniref:Class A beta-lactamase-related serine hydrolase n=1 Tax=Paenirhodobacter populi TaxID=2306993 RepID=A0A443KNI9_9RHOB|nr:serine hydrolase domain-containing protein [Sinirhodobacter populi]RWR34254.1 class A beta-lactamase-related serine hydrolase [Sinirhodobacter populi]